LLWIDFIVEPQDDIRTKLLIKFKKTLNKNWYSGKSVLKFLIQAFRDTEAKSKMPITLSIIVGLYTLCTPYTFMYINDNDMIFEDVSIFHTIAFLILNLTHAILWAWNFYFMLMILKGL